MTEAVQLPLFHGAPTPVILAELSQEGCDKWMEKNMATKRVRTLLISTCKLPKYEVKCKRKFSTKHFKHVQSMTNCQIKC